MPMMRRRGPGLLATAVVAGGAARAGAASANKQAAAQAQQAAPAAPAPAAPAQDPTTAELQKLSELHNQGILTDEEFTAAKKKALGI